VSLNEAYGETQSNIDDARHWFYYSSLEIAMGNPKYDPESSNTVVNTLNDWAAKDALSSGIRVSWGSRPVDWQVMTLIGAILYSTASVADQLNEDDRRLIGPWLNRLVKSIGSSYWMTRQDNKAYMRAYYVMLWGFMVGDKWAVQQSIDVYKHAINEMRPDGSFPIDSQRSGMGLKYGADSLGYLIYMVGLVKRNTGMPLENYSVDGRKLEQGVNYLLSAIESPTEVNQRYAIPCPDGGDRWGSIKRPSRSFLTSSHFLRGFLALVPNYHSADVIRQYYPKDYYMSEVLGITSETVFREVE
jgi:hypothetical protein